MKVQLRKTPTFNGGFGDLARSIASFSKLGATESLDLAKSLIYADGDGDSKVSIEVEDDIVLSEVKKQCEEFGIEVKLLVDE